MSDREEALNALDIALNKLPEPAMGDDVDLADWVRDNIQTIRKALAAKEPAYKDMCEEMAECLEYFSRLESYSDVGGIFQIKTDNIMYAKNILTKWNAMKGKENE